MGGEKWLVTYMEYSNLRSVQVETTFGFIGSYLTSLGVYEHTIIKVERVPELQLT